MLIQGVSQTMARILVVEDDDDLQFLYDKMLVHQGYEVVAARNTTQAFLYLTNEDFDAIILDINMPDAPGTKVLEFTHEDVRLRRIPILVVSANEKYRAQAQASGARYFLVKPVSLQDLSAAIKDVLNRE
jgi:CheY-like chemotaxis protein